MDGITGKTLIFLSLVATEPVLKDEYGVAADNARRALLLYPEVKSEYKALQKTGEKYLIDLGIDKDDLVYAAWVVPLVTQRISTRPFKKLKYETKNYVLRPELTYDLQNDNFNGMMVLIIKRSNK